MKATVNRKDIVKAINRVNPFISLNPSHYRSANVKLDCSNTGLSITGSHHKYKVVSRVVCDCEQTGSLVLNFRRFEMAIKKHEQKKIKLYDDKDKLYIDYGLGVVKLRKIWIDEYQEKESFDSVHTVILPKYWDNILKKVLSSVGTDFRKHPLTGIYFEIGPEGMCVTSTNGLVLSHIESVDITLPKNIKFIVPKFTLEVVLKNRCDKIIVNDNFICFINSSNGTKIISPFIEGPYPNYHNFIPNNQQVYAVINRKSLIRSIYSLLLFKYDKITFSFNDILVMEVKSYDGSYEITEKLPIKYYGKPLCMAFNSNNIIDVLNEIGDNTIIWYLNSPDKPCIIKPKKTVFVDEIYSIVPLRL